jgi:DNA-binding response OmpR family regulator
MLVAAEGEPVVSERLLVHVWGAPGEGDRQLLKQLVHRLRQKIERDPASAAILITDRGGYRLQP